MFSDLHLDLHLYVISFLEPWDIIIVGMTCKHLHETCSRRSVWTSALRRMCLLNGVFLPTFDFDNMSTDALQSAATGPDRTISLFSKSALSTDSELIMPLSSKEISAPKIANHQTIFFSLFLVPGGRFLVTSGTNALAVWDLNPKDIGSPMILIPLKKVDVRPDAFLVCPAPDNTAVRVALLGTFREGNGRKRAKFMIYELYLSKYATKTPLLYSLPLEVRDVLDVDIFTMSGNFFCYGYEDCLQLWNFVDDTYRRWTIPHDDYVNILISGDHVITVSRKRISGWSISKMELSPRKTAQGKPPLHTPPSFIIPMTPPEIAEVDPDDEGSPAEVHCERLQDWYNGTHPFTTLDVAYIHRELNDYPVFALDISLPKSNIPGTIALRNSSEVPYNFVSDYSPLNNRVCGEYIVKGRLEDSDLYVVSLIPNTPAGLSPLRTSAALATPGLCKVDHSRDEYAFDPVSGRLCFTQDDEGLSIVVLDYLAGAV